MTLTIQDLGALGELLGSDNRGPQTRLRKLKY